MTDERWNQLMKDMNSELTQEELDNGWFFCCEWDGMLINITDDEAKACTCQVNGMKDILDEKSYSD